MSPRGGARAGRPGATYGNRTDLGVAKLPAVAAPGQVYGVGKQQTDAQQAVPMAPQPVPQTPQGPPPAQPVQPGSLGALDRPTERPNEPVTAGAPVGPGPNNIPGLPGQQGPGASYSTARDLIRGLVTQNPGNDALAYLNGALGNGA